MHPPQESKKNDFITTAFGPHMTGLIVPGTLNKIFKSRVKNLSIIIESSKF